MTSQDIYDRLRASLDDTNESQYPPKQPFAVPDGYFDNLTSTVMAKVECQPQKKTTRVVSIRTRVWGVAASVAAVAVVALGIGLFFQSQQQQLSDSVDALIASDQEVDELIDMVGEQDIEDMLAEVDFFDYE